MGDWKVTLQPHSPRARPLHLWIINSTKTQAGLACIVDYMKCKTLWGKSFWKKSGKRNHACKKIQLTGQSLTSEYVWKHCECKKRTLLLFPNLQCLFTPTVACMAEHMFSEQELKQKVFFVITHSFVYTSLFPFWSHANSSYTEHLSSEGLHSSVCFSDYLLLLKSVELRCTRRLTWLICTLDCLDFAVLNHAEYNLHTLTQPAVWIFNINNYVQF